jgi:LysR family glycine cleavage system transcriptional activator
VPRTPPLNAIRAFEAAGRLSSLTAAARELHVTPAAVSHQIKALEAHLKVALFVRGHRAVTLTPAGARYLPELTRHLAGIERSTARVMAVAGQRTLRIQAHATFAMRWLIPRLSSFHAAHPKVDVQLTTSLQSVDFDDTAFDCAIKLGNGEWKGLRALALVRNELTPACTPAIARRRHLARPEGLAKETLLHSLARPDDWAHWLGAVGVTSIDPHRGLKYDSSVLAYQAAIEGQGVAIAQKALITADVEAGRLVYPFRKTLDMGACTYYFVHALDGTPTPELAHFRTWIIQQAKHG